MQHTLSASYRSEQSTLSSSLLRAITGIEIEKGFSMMRAVGQLEIAGSVIVHGPIEQSVAGPMKASFMQKVGQVQDLGLDTFKNILHAPWVKNTCEALDRYAAGVDDDHGTRDARALMQPAHGGAGYDNRRGFHAGMHT